jgi:hypothetical protein
MPLLLRKPRIDAAQFHVRARKQDDYGMECHDNLKDE